MTLAPLRGKVMEWLTRSIASMGIAGALIELWLRYDGRLAAAVDVVLA